MKKLICFFSLSFIIFSSVNIFATQLPTDFLATLNTQQQNQEQEEEKEVADPYSIAFGGNFSSGNTISFYEEQELFFKNTENLSLWLKLPLSKDYKSFFACEGFYDFSVAANSNEENNGTDFNINNTLDIPLFKFAFNIYSDKVITDINLGRFYFTDTTGVIFYQSVDGLFTNFNINKTELSLFAGYTGLINARNTTYFNNPYNDTANIYALSPKFLVASARGKFNIFNTQFFNAEFFTSFDLGKLDYNKIYTTLTFNGAISQRFFYILQSTLGMNIKSDGSEKLAIANLSKIDLATYFSFLNSSLTFSGVYASGNTKGISAFQPVSEIESSVIGHTFSSMMRAGVIYTFKPVDSLYISLDSDGICSFKEIDSALIFDGIQWKIEAKWQIVSDVYVSLNGQQFISFVDETPNYFLAGLNLGFSF